MMFLLLVKMIISYCQFFFLQWDLEEHKQKKKKQTNKTKKVKPTNKLTLLKPNEEPTCTSNFTRFCRLNYRTPLIFIVLTIKRNKNLINA